MNNAAASSTGSVILDDLAEVIGEAAAFALAWEFRGLRLYVPKDPALEPRIAAAIGPELAAKFCDAFWRTAIQMPMREATRIKVHVLRGEGRTIIEIARELGIAERQVYRLLESPPRAINAADRAADDRQMTMF